MSLLSNVLQADELGLTIQSLTQQYRPKTVLEIGSSDGTGSTAVFIDAMNDTGGELFCIEMEADRFEQLITNTAQYDFVHPYWCSSVGLDGMMTWREVIALSKHYPQWNCWKSMTMQEFKTWHDNQTDQIPEMVEGIKYIKADHKIDIFDMVFIDGSPFSATAEFNQVVGAGIIILDDTVDIKCHDLFVTLMNRTDYSLIKRNDMYRNGYAVFKHSDYANS